MNVKTEIGPIRPPSESHSLLLRFSRNCPWNKCLFCPVYKKEKFSLRPFNELKKEILFLSSLNKKIKNLLHSQSISELSLNLSKYFKYEEISDARRLLHWLYHGEYTVFIQDADPLFRKKEEIIELISLLKSEFPEIKRITSYARARTIKRFSISDLEQLRQSGLNRIHMGLESGSKEVLNFVCKGLEPSDIIEACEKLSVAHIETSLYVMPGLGGKEFSKLHVSETIKVINQSKPNFLRIRTLGLNPSMPLYQLYKEGKFLAPSEKEIVLEVKDIIEGITVAVKFYSDHNLNLLMEINGSLPEDRVKMLNKIEKFLNLDKEKMDLFILARRLNKVFDLSEFLAFEKDEYLQEVYEKIKFIPDEEKESLFLELRSQNL
ncbi:MAG: radical SAM protein [Proteobacteria bacterium]|nr:radical SAM protein [Pseudomonadota bacterium]